MPFQPTIDGTLVIGQTLDLFSRGAAADVPLIIGNVRNETASWIMASPVPVTAALWTEIISNVYKTSYQPILSIYPPLNDSRLSMARLATDYIFACSSRHAAAVLSAQASSGLRSSSTYWYTMTHPPRLDPLNATPECQNNVCHAGELPFVFRSIGLYSNPPYYFTAEESALSLEMHNYWARFVKGDSSFASDWKPFSGIESDQGPRMQFDTGGPRMVTGFRADECALWDSHGY
jgi:carboxylesterase type B